MLETSGVFSQLIGKEPPSGVYRGSYNRRFIQRIQAASTIMDTAYVITHNPTSEPQSLRSMLHLMNVKVPDTKHSILSKTILCQGLRLLFHCEYHVLVEYIECIVLLVLVVYNSTLAHLPNVVYYPDGVDRWGVRAMENILLFAALEIVSLIVYHKFLQRKLGFSPLYHLAFVFETQATMVQASLFVNILNLLQYELLHLGIRPCGVLFSKSS
ncbi:unnamed protein product [Phytophthora lilii]|uniref:Unnamed protein product n=1 Tax=Phytophthora lilii TaxID=2077276 RepID=A0A9W6TJP6_9STRA|nr:unnamed protein product [Phytophthora lilii]